MGLTKWSSEQTSKFIALYREQECLWRIDSMEYRNKKMRDDALNRISQGMQMSALTIEDVKKKIKHLRSTYLMELRKVEKCFDSSTVYTPSLSWYKEMDDFIRDVTVKRSICNISSRAVGEFLVNDSDIQTEYEQDLQDQQEDQAAESDEGDFSKSLQASTSFGINPLPDIKLKKTRLRKFNSLIDELKTFVDETKGRKENDEFDIFGKHVAVQLRSLPLEEALIVQKKIQSVITHSRINSLKGQPRNSNDRMAKTKLSKQRYTSSDSDDSSECSISLVKKENE
ncbi:hypothetical protein EVAR_43755_1 [Eumeta japonica]|uniref:MADF domain-containing protein n=1 Tax=Eumeta variegata TaxID=151549 RepID=A0A4C1XL47_EUMVA|nr:hypothetical protein EVAR_43755_1 [Eumeta japonica]